MTTQILTAISHDTALQTFPFPSLYGQNTAHRCWIQTGRSGPVSQRTSFRQSLWSTTYNPTLNHWTTPKPRIIADIVLLFVPTTLTDPTNPNQNLPDTYSINFADITTQQLHDFISGHNLGPSNNNPTSKIPQISTPYFNSVQRQLILKALTERNHNFSSNPILWSEPTDPTLASQLAAVNLNLGHLQINNTIKKQTRKAAAQTPEGLALAHQERFYRAYTLFAFPNCNHGKGFAHPNDYQKMELAILDEKGATSPDTLARWNKHNIIYTFCHNIPTDSSIPHLHPAELDKLRELYIQTQPTPT